MPELPDVEIFKQYLDATSLHRKISTVAKCDGRLLEGVTQNKFKKNLTGRTISKTHRHGKYLFARLDDREYLVLHFGMTGFLQAYKDDDKKPEHIGLLLKFEDGYQLAYDCRRRLGHISITDTVDKFVGEKKLGPDALALCRDKKSFIARLKGHRGTVKSLLMNQKILAGIGNVYADEILYLAAMHPKMKAGDLTAAALGTLASKTGHILQTAINRRAGAEGWPRTWLLPRREAGRKCPRCGGQIKRITISGRGTYFCPDHQG